ncbi:hypothetical protein [Dyella agri]|uniref:Uncharacterized protein n=1 Tax=Dyella agri TaxID=1926869 RepID=A0ABW8KHE4_9GAMM
MTKKPLLDRVVMAYRPLYLQGLLLDGQYRLPQSARRKDAQGRPMHRRRFSLVALLGLHHFVPTIRSRK